jgi:hypothetical protein
MTHLGVSSMVFEPDGLAEVGVVIISVSDVGEGLSSLVKL